MVKREKMKIQKIKWRNRNTDDCGGDWIKDNIAEVT